MIRTYDIFSGLGGSSYGAAAAGATIVGGIDAWDLAVQVFADNFPSARVSAGSVEKQEPRRIVEQVGRIDLLLASPECTNHSCARGARPRSDRSRDLAFEVVRYARAIAPRWIVIENVIQMRSWSRYREFLAALGGAGYRLAEHVLDAADHGAPQRRRRLFLLCDREAEPPSRIPRRRGPKPSAARVLDRSGIWRRSPLDNGRRAPATLARARRAVTALGSDSPFLIVYYGNDGAGGWQPLTVPLRTVTTLDRFGLCEPSRDGATLRMLQIPELARHGIQGRSDPPPGLALRPGRASRQRGMPAGHGGRGQGSRRKRIAGFRGRLPRQRSTGTGIGGWRCGCGVW